MKSRFGIVFATMIVAFIVGTGLFRYFRTQMDTLFEVQVPFDFRVGSSHLSAGHYRIFHAGSQLIFFQRNDGKANAWIPVTASDTPPGKSASQLSSTNTRISTSCRRCGQRRTTRGTTAFRLGSEQILLASQHRSGEVTVMAMR